MAPSFLVISSFYPAAQRAIHYADGLASAVGSRLVLVHANRASLYDPYVFVGETMRQQELGWEVETGALLAQLARQLAAPATVELTTDLLPGVAQDVAERNGPALFVLGLPAASVAASQQTSDAILELLRAAQLPLLVVPAGTATSAPPRRVVVAADGESFALTSAVAAVVNGLLPSLGAEVTVAYVSAAENDAECARALRAVHGGGLTATPPSTDLRGYLSDKPATGLLEAIEDVGADLLVVLARSRSYLGELFHRSVTAQLIERSPVPVLVLPVVEAPVAQRQRKQPATDDSLRWPEV